jgi:ADP-ribosylglycohydrolase
MGSNEKKAAEDDAKALPGLKADPWATDSDPSLHIGGGGWRAHETLVIALLAADMLPDNPWLALRRSAATDGDSDTIGAVTGGILGAMYPTEFLAMWTELRGRFEDRYVRWIENEADNYVFAAPRRTWWQRLLRVR